CSCHASQYNATTNRKWYYREGGTEKHLRDIRSMIAVSGGQIDRPALDEWIERRGLQTEWRLVSG
ncbi:MAG TPA: hypothetical protein PK202_12610, partial [Verrucomicrobiota bacterium]|nr:hypothetical protein [Verrucomicrobiota bacterium]